MGEISFWFNMFWICLLFSVLSVIALIMRQKVSKREQKRKSIVGKDYYRGTRNYGM